MTMNKINELKEKSKNKNCFLYMKNGEWFVCEDIAILPFKDTSLGEYIESKEKAYNDKIEALESKVEKQDKIINELISAIKTLNK